MDRVRAGGARIDEISQYFTWALHPPAVKAFLKDTKTRKSGNDFCLLDIYKGVPRLFALLDGKGGKIPF